MGKYVVKSGGREAGDGSIEIVDNLPEDPNTNTVYKYIDEKMGDLLMMYCDGHWRYTPLLLYPQKTFISPAEIYATGHVFENTPSNTISVVDLDGPIQVGKLIATKALKIFGGGKDVNNIKYGWTFEFNVPENITLGERYLYIGVSAEGGNYDYGTVIINNGEEISYKPASNTFSVYAIQLKTLKSGKNTITVKYIKDSSGTQLDDCVYIYGVDYLYTM